MKYSLSIVGLGLLLVIALLMPTYVMGGNLYPRCGGEVFAQEVQPGMSKRLMKVDKHHSRLKVDCVAVETELMGKNDGSCPSGDEKNANLRLYLKANWVNEDDDEESMEWDLYDTIGGSVQSLVVSVQKKASFSLMAAHTGSHCVYNVKALFQYKTVSQSSEEKSELLPAMTSLFPMTVYADRRSTDTYFQFKYFGTHSDGDKVTLIPGHMSCHSGGADGRVAASTTHMEYTRVSHIAVDDTKLKHHAWYKYKFDTPGNYRVCYKYRDLAFEEVAIISVFGGNPGYFEIVSGDGANGQVFVDVDMVARFYGDGLNTQNGGDEVKFVDDAVSCAAGLPAGGTPAVNDLGPYDSSNTNIAEWKFKLTEGGSFRVCYKRKDHDWIEVVNVDDLPPEARHSTAAPIDQYPPPTNAVTHKDCPTAPHRNNQPETATYLILEVYQPVLPDKWKVDLQQFLCLPKDTLDFVAVTHRLGHTYVMLDIVCNGIRIHEKCSGRERKNMLLHLHHVHDATLETELSVHNVKEMPVEGIIALPDDKFEQELANKGKSSGSSALTVMLLLMLLVAAAAGLYLLKNYQQGHSQFMHIGSGEAEDDDDEEDDDSPTALPGLPVKNSHASVPVGRAARKAEDQGTELY